MINDLLDITSDRGGNRSSCPSSRSIVAELLAETVGLLQPLAVGRRRRRLPVTGVRRAPGRVRADRRRLKQVLLNVVGNAIKYNRPGGRVDIGVDRAGRRPWSIVSVTDTGLGIPADDLPRLFSPFDRLGREASEVEGSGIGLALSHRLLVAMDGNLDVDSTAGEGSTFTIVLPAAEAVEAAPRDAGTGDLPIDPRPAPVASLLYIEDSRPSVDLLAAVLTRRPDWTMTHVQTADEGVAAAITSRPTAVMVELHLAGGGGVDVVRRLRGHPDTEDLPIAVVSAAATPRQVRDLLAGGADRYLTKPIRVEEIFAFLDGLAR